METHPTNNFALITGASAGIGKQIALECAKRNFNLFLISLPNSGLEKFAEELKTNFSVIIHILSLDLTLKNAPSKVFSYAQRNKIKVNFLVNNAGVGFDGRFENLPADLIDKMILLNVRASTLLTYWFLPEMKKLKNAYILNISSFGALTPLPFKCVYAATKSYLLFLTEAINYELKGTNVKAISIHPSGVSSERVMQNIKSSSLIARLSTLSPEKVAKIAVENVLAGKKFIIPGVVSKFYYVAAGILPYLLVLRIVSKVFCNKS